MALTKLAAAQVEQLMTKAASAIRDLESENIRLKGVIEARDRAEKASDIAKVAAARGFVDDAGEYAKTLNSDSSDLGAIANLLGIATGGIPLGEMTKEAGATASADTPESRFAAGLLHLQG